LPVTWIIRLIISKSTIGNVNRYCFYKPDLIHPNEVAEAHIFEQFANTYFDQKLSTFAEEWQKTRQAMAHTPLQPNTATHRQFLIDPIVSLLSLALLYAQLTRY